MLFIYLFYLQSATSYFVHKNSQRLNGIYGHLGKDDPVSEACVPASAPRHLLDVHVAAYVHVITLPTHVRPHKVGNLGVDGRIYI